MLREVAYFPWVGSHSTSGQLVHAMHHLFECVVYALDGRGATSFWQEGKPKQTLEWQKGSIFSPPPAVGGLHASDADS